MDDLANQLGPIGLGRLGRCSSDDGAERSEDDGLGGFLVSDEMLDLGDRLSAALAGRMAAARSTLRWQNSP